MKQISYLKVSQHTRMLPAYILFTALGAQFVYILVNWYFFRRKEYFFYSIYILVIAAYFSNKYIADLTGTVHIDHYQYNKLYPDKTLAILSYIFYFKFARHFTEAAHRYPSVNRIMKMSESSLFIYVIFDIVLLLFTGNVQLENYFFLPVNVSIFIMLVYVFRKLILKNETLDRFILTGSLCYAVCACITMWLGQNRDPLQDDHIVVLQIGALIEMVFLNAGLVYKSRMLQNQTVNSQKELIEKYRENQDLLLRLGSIRENISRDLHDDIGGELSAIHLLSEMKTADTKPEDQLSKISDYSAGMVQKLNEIVWALNINNDTLQSLIAYIRRYTVKYLDDLGLECAFHQEPENVPQMQVDGPTRRNIFLLVKEVLNNIVKHAQATKVFVNVCITDKLIIIVKDNGKGIPMDVLNKDRGNGFRNMRKRVEELAGHLEIKNWDGTTVTFVLPVAMDNTKVV